MLKSILIIVLTLTVTTGLQAYTYAVKYRVSGITSVDKVEAPTGGQAKKIVAAKIGPNGTVLEAKRVDD